VFAAAEGASREAALGWPLLFVALAVAGFLIHQRDQAAAPGLMRRAYYALAYTATLTWLAAAAVLSPTDPLVLEVFAAATAAASAGWWARHLRRRERTEPPAAQRDEFAALREEITAWWAECATAERDGFALGSKLLDVRADEIGAYLDVQLNAKRQSYDDLTSLAVHKRMAATRGTARQMITFERWDDQREDRAKVILFTKNLLQENVPFPGPAIDLDTGCAVVGRRADGKPARIRFWQPKSGTNMEVVVGCSGSGKSRYLDEALLCERHALDPQGRHLIVSWICDPQEGQSLPDWQDRVDRFARGPLEGLAMLEDAFAEMIARNKLLSQVKWNDDKGREHRGLSYYDPKAYADLGVDLDLPILSVTIDEAPMVLAHPRAKWLIERLVSMGRKCGIRLRLVTQIPSIAELGNSFTIRPLLAAMSVVCLRTDDAITGGAFPKLPGNPRDLEEQFPDGSKTFGLGYILGADRPAKFRTFFLDDNAVFDWADAGTTAHLSPLATAQDVAEAKAEEAGAAGQEPQDAPSGPEAAAVGSARQLIRAYLSNHPGHVTSGTLVAELGLNNSTVSQALARDVAAGKILRVTHGVYAALGTDPGLWRDEHASMAA
jgi:hypothetical protein